MSQRVRSSGSGVADGLDLDLDLRQLGDEDTAALERLVPRQAELLTVDLGRCGEDGLVVAERVGQRALVLEVEGDRAALAVHGQLAVDGPLLPGRADAGRAEGDRGELLGVEEV